MAASREVVIEPVAENAPVLRVGVGRTLVVGTMVAVGVATSVDVATTAVGWPWRQAPYRAVPAMTTIRKARPAPARHAQGDPAP